MEKSYEQLKDPEYFFAHLNKMSEEELIEFIRVWHSAGESSTEIKKFVDFVYKMQAPIDTGFNCFDCSGTGGDCADTFNISTAAAIVAAGSGVKVTKHGGRSTTSQAGSVDVLEALGFDINQNQEMKLKKLKENNLAFFASKVTGEFLVPVKKVLRKYKETGFISLLGPMTNPVKLKGQLVGAANVKWSDVLAETLLRLKRERAMVVYSGAPDASFKLDEISAVSLTRIVDIEVPPGTEFDEENFREDLDKKIEDKVIKFKPRIFSPEDIRLPMGTIDELKGGDAKTNAGIIGDILDYDPKVRGTKTNAVCLNAAALLELAGLAKDIKEGYEICLENIASGKIKSNFEKFLA